MNAGVIIVGSGDNSQLRRLLISHGILSSRARWAAEALEELNEKSSLLYVVDTTESAMKLLHLALLPTHANLRPNLVVTTVYAVTANSTARGITAGDYRVKPRDPREMLANLKIMPTHYGLVSSSFEGPNKN